MAADEELVTRIREALVDEPNVEEKKMFSGITFMVNEKMCISVGPARIMCRIAPELQLTALERPGTSEMIMRGRTMIGYVYVAKEVLSAHHELRYWVDLCLTFTHFLTQHALSPIN